MNKAVFNQNLLNIWSNLKRLAQISHQLGVACIRYFDGVHPPIGCLQFNHSLAIENLRVSDFAYVAGNQIGERKVELIL
ncbi:MAG: Uncharacterised protein [Synechococcus sp. CC9902]|nr:MAG: Uncharacterised protein [Synechococcus sp. CC9902]